MGLHHPIQSSRDRNAHHKIPNQVLLHHGEHSQSSVAHTNHISIQKNTHLVPVPLLPNQQKPKQILAQKQQALLHTQPFQFLLRLLPRLIRVLYARSQIKLGCSISNAPLRLQHFRQVFGENRHGFH